MMERKISEDEEPRDTRPVAIKCSAIARSGTRCDAPVLLGSSFCFLHAPETAEARKAAARRGGHARSNKARAKKLIPEGMNAADLADWLAGLFLDVQAGRVESRIGTACAAIARAQLDAQTAATRAGSVDNDEVSPTVAKWVTQLAIAQVLLAEKDETIHQLKEEVTILRTRIAECAKGN
jgi:hypothetical protein